MGMSRRQMLKASGAAGVALAARSGGLMGEMASGKPGLTAAAFQMLPLGEVRPAGWLTRQLRIQADGMGGHLDEFWPDVGADSGWLGGKGESWERGPYFLDGLLPLAYLLDDEGLKAKALKFVNWTLENQQPSGMIGPGSNDDWWPRMVIVKALMQYQQVSGNPRVLPLLTKYFHYQLDALPQRPLVSWGKYRWQDEVLVVEWLYDQTRDPQLLKLCALLKQQGYDWEAAFADFKATEPTSHDLLTPHTPESDEAALKLHGVNHSQALKTAAVQYRMSGDRGEREKYFHQIGLLDRYHGMPNGMFSCDEHLGGLDTSQGTELCSVVETMFSMEVALAAFGDATIGDRVERLAYNALPGTFTDDMWAHQYDQQPNQIQVGLNSKPWTTNGPESNLYGLEPNFGCCTANFHQGWPKFTSSLWMKTPDEGLAATLYAPCTVKTKLRGGAVQLAVETEYPFRETIRVNVSPEKPMRFPLLLRIPAWATDASIQLNGKAVGTPIKPGSFARVERVWAAGDVVEVKLPMRPRVSRWFRNSVALERGPLVFSLQPGGEWVKLRDRKPTADWQVFPTQRWNYALAVDEARAATVRVQEFPVGARPFSAEGAAVKLQLSGRVLDKWRSEDGVALPMPKSPVASDRPEETLTLIPYAAAKLRVTAFPQLQA